MKRSLAAPCRRSMSRPRSVPVSPTPRFRGPGRLALLVAALLAAIGASLLGPFGWPVRLAGLAVLIACYALMPKGFRVPGMSGPAAMLLRWGAAGFFSSLLVLTLAREVSLAATALLATAATHEAWVRASALAVMIATPLVTAVGYLMARGVARVVDVEIPVAGLPPALEGFTIAQISDIHVGPTIRRRYVERIVERVNGLSPDLIAITGDIVDGSVAELGAHVAPLAQLRSRHGTYAVTGNHEYYSGAPAWIRELRRLGARVLLNEHVVIEHDGAQLALAGVTDYSAHHFDPTHRSDPHRAAEGVPSGSPKVLLAHQPRSAREAERAGFDVQLSGHTHGGQFWPWNHFVRLQQPFTAGLHRVGKLWVYVSRGTGYWGPPKRLGAPSEITLLRLKHA